MALLRLAWPTIATFSLLAIRSLVDVFCAGRLGTAELAALTPAQIVILLTLSFGFGVLFLVNSTVAHSIGAAREDECGSYLWQGIWSSLLYGTLASVVLAVVTVPLFTLFAHPEEVQNAENAYFSIACLSIPFQLAAFATTNFFFGIGRPRIPLVIASLTFLAHSSLALILTHHPEVPPFFGGIRGIAWALIGSSLLQALISVAWMRFAPSLKPFKPENWGIVRSRMSDLWKEGVSVGFRDVIDNFVWSFVIVWLIGALGPVPLATASVFLALVDSLIIPCDGLGSAMVTRMGHDLGRGSPIRADRWRKLTSRISILYSLIVGTLLYCFRGPLFEFLAPETTVSHLCEELAIFLPVILFLYATYGVFDFALCATGDNRFPTLINVGCSAVILGGGGLVLLFQFPEAGSFGVWSLFSINLGIVVILFFLRWRTGKWQDLSLVENLGPKQDSNAS